MNLGKSSVLLNYLPDFLAGGGGIFVDKSLEAAYGALAQERVNLKERFPVDIGQEYMMDYINSYNAGSLYDKLTS